MPSSDHFAELQNLLELEAAEEIERMKVRNAARSPAAAESAGETLIKLQIVDEHPALGGRNVLELSKPDPSARLPWTRLGPGSPVVMSVGNDELRGVVTKRRRSRLFVSTNHEVPESFDDGGIRVDLSPDEITLRRQQAALTRVRSAKKGRTYELRKVFAQELEPAFETRAETESDVLNAKQREAIQFALGATDVALIHGPPGTGKTRTIAELIRRAVNSGETVLAAAPSNMAVDNLLERLLDLDLDCVRIGHPARVSESLVAHTLDAKLEEHEDMKLARKLVVEAFGLRRKLSRWTRARPDPGERRSLKAEAKALMADARRLEERAVERVLDTSDVVCVTTGVDIDMFGDRRFDLAVLDEACQATEPASWVPLALANRVVLAGDHKQLPPTIVSVEASKGGLSVSLFERLAEQIGESVMRQLEVQYRMHEHIMKFSSEQLYEDSLLADDSVADHTLVDLQDVAELPLTNMPVEFIDTAGADFEETLEPDGASRSNTKEAELVAKKVSALLDAGLAAEDVGVIAPYAAQVRLIRSLVPEAIEVDSVDGFQGREKEAIIISLVRSNEKGEIGFLSEVRRMNVALTRARRKLLVIADSATIGQHPFYGAMLEYFERVGAYRSVWEEM